MKNDKRPQPIVARTLILLITVMVGTMIVSPAFCGSTMDKVRSNGMLQCGVGEEIAGFSFKDKNGRREGFAADFCRAVAAASLGNSEKVTFVPLTPSARFPVLLSNKIDLLAHTATMTFGREVGIGVKFAGIYFFDGQAFMVPSKGKARKIEDLEGTTVCVEKGTTHESNLEDHFRAKRLNYKPLVVDSLPEMKEAFFSGKCQSCTSDRSSLAAIQLSAPGGAAQYLILPGNISKEPLGPVVRRGDEDWFELVRWVLYALIEAEERGVTSKNVRALQKSTSDPALSRFLNQIGSPKGSRGVKPGWVSGVIAQVGNYGEIYERNLGSGSRLKIERGLNRLWTKGGLLYAPPFD